MSKPLSLLLLGVLLLSAVPLSAGTVYVALASDQEIGGINYESILTVSNPSDQGGTFTTYFIPSFADGTERPDDLELEEIFMPPGSTRVFFGLTDGADRGMLEITASDFLVFAAKLVPAGPPRPGAIIPIASSSNLTRANSRFHLQNWERSDSVQTSFHLVNLATGTNICTITVFAADGTPLVSPTVLTLAGLSHNGWNDALGIIGVGDAVDARADVTCDRASAAFSHRIDTSTGEVTLPPISTTGNSGLRAPGTGPVCPDGADCFTLPGVFFTPVPGNDIIDFDVPLPDGEVYKRLTVEVTFRHGGWDRVADGLHGIFWLRRNDIWRGQTFGYVNLRGPNRNLFTSLINVGLPGGDTRRTTANVVLTPGQTYKVFYSYDTNTRLTTTTISTVDGIELASMTDRTLSNQIAVQDGFKLQVALHRELVEVPTHFWDYSDLLVTFQK